ncbi:MAG: hypothetical protein Kow0013_19540 [Pararhodobacter sp.]
MDPVYWFLIIGGLVFFLVTSPWRNKKRRRDGNADNGSFGWFDGGGSDGGESGSSAGDDSGGSD